MSASRPRISTDSGIDKRVIVIAVGVVGTVLAMVVLMMVVMFGGDSTGERDTARGSSSGRSDGERAENDAGGTLDFRRESRVTFGTAQTMPSSVPGVVWKEVPLKGSRSEPGAGGKLWVYLPEGNHEPGSLGCVLIGPAGSRMVHGMELADGDQAEHYPYAQQGFAVVAFEIDGPLPDENPTDDQFLDAYLKFRSSAAGVVNARAALQYASTELSEVDRDRIFVAGHSSAGTVALLCAGHIDGLAGCVAYAPCSDLAGFLSEFIGDIDGVLPDVREYMVDGSPMTHVEKLSCPVMIFHAVDDRVVGVGKSNSFSTRVKKAGGDITLKLAPRGGHYDAMIEEGINDAVAWMNRTKPAASISSKGAPSKSQKQPRPTPGFEPPKVSTSTRSEPPAVSTSPPISSSGSVRAHVHFQVISYPSANAEVIARDALRSVIWADPKSIRVDRSANEIVIGVRITSVNTNDAKLRLEEVGFTIGRASYVPVRR